jgi:cell division protein FtsW
VSGRILRFDRKLLLVSVFLVALGIIMIYSSSAVFALEKKGQADYYFVRQCFWAGIGMVGMLVAMRIPHTFWKAKRVVLSLAAVQACLLLLALLGPAVNGSHRWIRLGPLTLQPSESAKLVVVVFAAYLLEKRFREGRREWFPTLLSLGLYCAFCAAAILVQPDLGSVVVLGGILMVLLFVEGIPLSWFGALAATGAAGVVALVLTSPYRMQRLMSFLHPELDPQHAGFQARQSLIAVGSGGLTGQWSSGGSQKLLFLPLPHTDFIYAMIGEELGLVGTLLVLAAFLLFGYLGYRTVLALYEQDRFGALVACGITSWVLFQAMLHIGVTLTLLPTKGLPLPLISYGGSALVVSMTGVGMLLSLSQYK